MAGEDEIQRPITQNGKFNFEFVHMVNVLMSLGIMSTSGKQLAIDASNNHEQPVAVILFMLFSCLTLFKQIMLVGTTSRKAKTSKRANFFLEYGTMFILVANVSMILAIVFHFPYLTSEFNSPDRNLSYMYANLTLTTEGPAVNYGIQPTLDGSFNSIISVSDSHDTYIVNS